ncbi:hypothetical protein N665_0437s0017 [Sinapis alba]|nr:hypothetical protein N665_0437s0017 [Sinapis alba]
MIMNALTNNNRSASFGWMLEQSLDHSASSPVLLASIPLNATLVSLHIDSNWHIPPARSEALVNLYAHLTTIHLNDDADFYEWEIDGVFFEKYRISQVYGKLYDERIPVSWYDMVWNKSGIPRHRFLSWMFVLNRYPTKNRITSWRLSTNPTCVPCNLSNESRNHLFFSCSFSWNIWPPFALICGLQSESSWDRVMAQIQAVARNSSKGILLRICWKASIYWIWAKRNARIHRQIWWKSLMVNLPCGSSLPPPSLLCSPPQPQAVPFLSLLFARCSEFSGFHGNFQKSEVSLDSMELRRREMKRTTLGWP